MPVNICLLKLCFTAKGPVDDRVRFTKLKLNICLRFWPMTLLNFADDFFCAVQQRPLSWKQLLEDNAKSTQFVRKQKLRIPNKVLMSVLTVFLQTREMISARQQQNSKFTCWFVCAQLGCVLGEKREHPKNRSVDACLKPFLLTEG